MKKIKAIYLIFMLNLAFFVLLNFGIHAYRTNLYNQKIRTIDETTADEGYSFTFTPQNGNEVSWTRTANIDGEAIDMYACSFEGVFTNSGDAEVTNWTLRLDITDDCYLNTGWCGTMEIHQHDGAQERVQSLDLRAVNPEEVDLTFYEDGDIFLFPLHKGDYIIYYPNGEAKEYPIMPSRTEPAKIGIGIIIYRAQDADFVIPNYQVTYQNHKDYLKGSEATIFKVVGGLWLLLLIIGITVFISEIVVQNKTKIELSKKEIAKETAEKVLDEMIRALAFTIDAKDEYTLGHSARVAEYSFKLAAELDCSDEFRKEVFYAGLVHDVGKIAIPDEIINKPGKLNPDEFEVIKSHPIRGERILLHIEDMPCLAVGARHHHERYDGSGYPDHLKGEAIPMIARIIAVADAYDAMTSKRSYRHSMEHPVARQEIVNGMGTQFDPIIARKMLDLIDQDVHFDMREKRE